MNCIFCDHHQTIVLSTEKYDSCVIRIRKCCRCGMAFRTFEEVHDETGVAIWLRALPPETQKHDSTKREKDTNQNDFYLQDDE